MGRPRLYLRIDEFNAWKTNDYQHLVDDVKLLAKDAKLNRKLLIGVLIATITLPTVFMITIVQLLG